MKRFLQWWKGQPVLGISLLAALVSMCFVPPDAGYLSYCNRAVLIQLFCLMLTVAGLRSIGVFEQVTQNLLKRAGTVRRVGLFLVQLCFFSAMLVTNDVALLTFCAADAAAVPGHRGREKPHPGHCPGDGCCESGQYDDAGGQSPEPVPLCGVPAAHRRLFSVPCSLPAC